MSYQDYQNYKNARDAAWRILIDCNINRLPVNLNLICKALKIRVLSYGDASHLIKSHRLSNITASMDGLTFFVENVPVVLYNEAWHTRAYPIYDWARNRPYYFRTC